MITVREMKLAVPFSVQDALFKTELELVELLDVPFEEVQSALAIISAKVCPPCHSVRFLTFSSFWGGCCLPVVCFFDSTNGLNLVRFKRKLGFVVLYMICAISYRFLTF
jgi:hypothetical protein